jgi:hypothetical protein
VELDDLERAIEAHRHAARTLALDVEALRVTDYFSAMHERKAKELATAEQELQALQARRTETTETRIAVASYLDRVQRGDWGDPQAHIHHAHHPDPPAKPHGRIVDLWAAFSGALALLIFVSLLIERPSYWWAWAIGVGTVFGAVEAATRGRITNYLLSVVVVLAAITTLILIGEFWQTIVVLLLIVVVVVMVRDNLRELRGG